MDVLEVLRRWDVQPSKGAGQNFLVDPVVLQKIVAAADLTSDDVVLEVGAGVGNLTERLALAAAHVVAVEMDRDLIPVLRSTLARFDNVTLVEGDILDLNPADLLGDFIPPLRYKVVANLPYYITSAILRHLLETTYKPCQMVLTMQWEVAKRIVARPGDMSLLAVSVQFYGQPQKLFRIKAGSFYPAPQVDSAVVRIDLYDTPPIPADDQADFFRVVKAGFSQRRKQLRNTLAAGLRMLPDEVETKLHAIGVDPQRRAQALTIDEWVKITEVLNP
ncbi:MAG TPA: 16S rRNA (adenine(1518)-N(6)/adenine(1519)-N(6))-dimethyltransferase RsmA [Chloroflexi bacterium]|nr:16S rRNA (adenine(1518)-N(6)/adenine(1519)-N(6))-dimethyltransferase RsmA [Chloroflexota bacterium]